MIQKFTLVLKDNEVIEPEVILLLAGVYLSINLCDRLKTPSVSEDIEEAD